MSQRRAVTVAVWSDALEFRIEGDNKAYFAEAEGAYFALIDKALAGRRVTKLEPGCLKDSGLRIELPSSFRGLKNPTLIGWAGFILRETKRNQPTLFAFDGNRPPTALMQEIVRAFDPEAPELAGTPAEKEKHHAEGKQQQADHPRAVRRAEAEGPGVEHPEGQPRRPKLRGRKRGRQAIEGNVQPDVKKQPGANLRGKRSKAERERLRKMVKDRTESAHRVREERARAALEAMNRNAGT